MSKPLAVITGASSGIGSVFARKLAAQGYDLLLVARRLERLEELAAELSRTQGAGVECCAADLATPGGVETVARRLADDARVSLLINNAGFGVTGRFFETSIEDHARMNRVHIEATLRLSHAALGAMVRRDRGAVINVSSVASFVRSPSSVTYCASKSWISAFTEGLYLDLKSRGSQVTVQALCPGFTYTEFHDVIGVKRETVPKWLWMSAADVVEASLAGLRKRKLFVVPGWRYRAVVALATKLPAGVRVAFETRSPHRRRKT